MSKSIYKKLSMGLLALLLNNNYLNLSAMDSKKTDDVTEKIIEAMNNDPLVNETPEEKVKNDPIMLKMLGSIRMQIVKTLENEVSKFGSNTKLGRIELYPVLLSSNLEKKRFQLEIKDIDGGVVKYPDNIDRDAEDAGFTLEEVKTKIKEFENKGKIKEIIVNILNKGSERKK